MNALIPALVALGLAGAPAESDQPAPPLVLHSDLQERARAIDEEFSLDEEACPNHVVSQTMIIPVINESQLYAYAFVTPRFCLARGVNRFDVTSQMHFVIDSMVRAAHRTPMTLNPDLTVERAEAEAAMLQAAREVIGVERLERLRLLGRDVRALR